MILRGPFGSGKTHSVFAAVTQAVRAGRDAAVRVVAPTSSMARHLQHEVARGGCALRTGAIQTLQQLVEGLTPGETTPPAHVLEWVIETAIADSGVGWESPGLARRAGETMQELWSAGTNALALRAVVTSAPQRELVRVMSRVEERLGELKFTPAPQRTARAARRIRDGALDGVEQLLFDGFVNLRPVERELVLAAQQRLSSVVLTWPESVAIPFPGVPVRTLESVQRALQRPTVVRAATPDAEVLETAALLLEDRQKHGRPWRDYGVILRQPAEYVPAFEAAFARLGVPYQAAGPGQLGEHPWVQTQLRLLHQAASGIDRKSLARWLCGPHFAGLPGGAGLSAARSLLSGAFAEGAAPEIQALSATLTSLGPPGGENQPPGQWAKAAAGLVAFTAPTPSVRPETPPLLPPAIQAAWLEALDQAAEFAQLRSPGPVSFVEYLTALTQVNAHAALPVANERRDVVHLLNVYESRQWELPVVFVCGLADKHFPQPAAQNLFFPDRERERLRARGIDLVTAAERHRDERFLFDSAICRATASLTITLPAHDEDGRPGLASPFVLGRAVKTVETVPVIAEAPRHPPPPAARLCAAAQQRADRRHEHFSPTGIESFVQCPFQFFASRTLQLEPAEPLDRQMPDGLWTGHVVHEVIARWTADSDRGISLLLDRVFAAHCRKAGWPLDFRLLCLREALRTDLARFAREFADTRIPASQRGGSEQSVAASVDAAEPERFRIKGRIDLWERLATGEAVVTDYKYATAARLQQLFAEHNAGTKLQLPLYLLALEQTQGLAPGGARLLGLKREISERGWMLKPSSKQHAAVSAAELRTILERARSTAREAIAAARGGAVAVEPLDRTVCERACSYRELCRIGA